MTQATDMNFLNASGGFDCLGFNAAFNLWIKDSGILNKFDNGLD